LKKNQKAKVSTLNQSQLSTGDKMKCNDYIMIAAQPTILGYYNAVCSLNTKRSNLAGSISLGSLK